MKGLAFISIAIVAISGLLVSCDNPNQKQIGAGYQNQISGKTYTQSFPQNGGK
jgi:hypothetical protein